jgi:pimeloyl-ACP methyl ester carboxylesterase
MRARFATFRRYRAVSSNFDRAAGLRPCIKMETGFLATFLFVHGAFCGGWSFDFLRPLLEAEGHTVLTPTLSGVGERAHLATLGAINLDTHIDDITNYIEWQDLRGIVLVGHSYGGMVVTGAADRVPDRIASLVYLDAVLPEDGETLFSILPVLTDLFTGASATHGGNLVGTLPAANLGVAPEHAAFLDARFTPHPIACFTQAIRLTGAVARVSERVLIYNSRDIGMPIPYAEQYEAMRDATTHVYALPAGHCLHIEDPQGTADILLRHVGN